MFEVLLDTEDKSFWTDQLEALTGKPRRYWARLPVRALREIYRKEIEHGEVLHEKEKISDRFRNLERPCGGRLSL